MRNDTIGNESIFVGKSAEDREETRQRLDKSREESLDSIKALTRKIKRPTDEQVPA